jgi:hypothetical protein
MKNYGNISVGKKVDVTFGMSWTSLTTCSMIMVSDLHEF